jgi:hypothetical protein
MTWERDRERGYEEQFARQEEQSFKAAAHRNRLFALWAAEKMHLRRRDAESYVETLVTGDIAHLRGQRIVGRVAQDLQAAGIGLTQVEVQTVFDRFDAEANAERRKTQD